MMNVPIIDAGKPNDVVPVQKKPKFDQLRADHEMFLKAFEKPTQIYRFLRTRNAVQPIFLHRTLSYMKHLRTPRPKHREKFKIDSMLEAVEKREKELDKKSKLQEDGFLNLSFNNFFFGSGPANGELSNNRKRSLIEEDHINVEVFLLKISNKRKKDGDAQVDQVLLGKATVPFNPSSQLLPVSSSGILSIPNMNFKGSKNYSKTYILMLQVAVPYRIPIKGAKKAKKDSSITTQDSPNNINDKGTPYKENSEPPAKRLQHSHNDCSEEEDSENVPDHLTEHTLYTAELIMFDNKRNCLLIDGQYELALQEMFKRPGRKRGLLSNKSLWENIFKGNMGPFEVFAFGPTLKFKLSWSSDAALPSPRRPTTLPLRPTHTNQLSSNSTDSDRKSEAEGSTEGDTKKKQTVYYQFIYNSHTRQQTEARDDTNCPWCNINCNDLYCLLKHLKLCHGRFRFTYAPLSKGACIDVCVNEHYDGSYAGRTEEINEILGYAFSREGPFKRVPQTQVLLWRPHRRRASLSEFLEPDDVEYESNRPYYKGHKRIYFHSPTCLPSLRSDPDEMSDSEAEENPDWMKMRTIQMIDEFTDVNDGEKELMKMWNLHLMNHCYQADSQVYKACCAFVECHSKDILDKNLKRNFLMHLVNLHDFDLLNASQMQHVMSKLTQHPTVSESCSE